MSHSVSVHLNFLKKISSITGELAVYKQSGILALVRIERITIEPDLLSFSLKPQRGRRIGLESLKRFTVSSTFEFLDHSGGRYYSPIVSWMLETDPVKVIYLSNLINGNASFDEILSSMRRRHVFYDDVTTSVVTRLIKLKNHIKNRKINLVCDSEFKGQSWGGAGVMVISNDEDTKNHYSVFHGVIVVSDNATQIGDLFRRVRGITSTLPKYNYLTKREMWRNLAQAANSVLQADSAATLGEVCDTVIMKAIEFVTQEPGRS